MAGSLKNLMEKITDAYQTLKDEKRRIAYDQKLAAKGTFNLERSKAESQETVEECVNQAQECLRARENSLARSLGENAPLMPGSRYRACWRQSGKFHAYRTKQASLRKPIGLDLWNTEVFLFWRDEALKLPRAHSHSMPKFWRLTPNTLRLARNSRRRCPKKDQGKIQSMISRIFGWRLGP